MALPKTDADYDRSWLRIGFNDKQRRTIEQAMNYDIAWLKAQAEHSEALHRMYVIAKMAEMMSIVWTSWGLAMRLQAENSGLKGLFEQVWVEENED